MRVRSLLLILVMAIVLMIFFNPRLLWAEIKRIQSQWDLIMRLLVTVIFVYICYGLYQLWAGNVAWWPF
ncbi:MAG: hypothetical protein KF893_16660 [Caldilineaceae bacterium]|nr:hypothetical protein [Caldilineaceae bacterium]